MRKIAPRRGGFKLPPVKLYFDDFREIVDTLSKAWDNSKVSLSSDEYMFDSLEDMSASGLREIKAFSISVSTEPYSIRSMNLSGEPGCVRLHTILEPSDRAYGVIMTTKELLEARRRWQHNGYLVLTVAIVVAIVFLTAFLFPYLLALSLGVIPIFVFVGFHLRGNLRSVVSLSIRGQEQPFFQKNRELWIGLFCAIAGAAAGYLFSLLR